MTGRPGGAGPAGQPGRTAPPAASRSRTGWSRELLHVPALGALAIAQPLLDVLGRGATFFVAHRFAFGDVVLLVLLLLALPLPLVLLEMAVARFSARAAALVRLLSIALLTSLIALQALSRAAEPAGRLTVPLALGIGAACALAYRRWPPVRQFAGFLGLALVVVPGVFFAGAQVRGLAGGHPVEAVAALAPGHRAPVVFVIFDELPVTSLMGPDHGIDARRFPNFAALAARSDWYRGAVATSDTTEYAVPALVTGRLAKVGALPQASSYPDNLFTTLRGSYRIYAVEALSQLCPPEINSLGTGEGPARARWPTLLADLGVVYGHVVLPAHLRRRLPPISSAWRGFGRAASAARGSGPAGATPGTAAAAALEALGDDRAATFRSFVGAIRKREEPSLYFLHVLLPHVPWQYTPRGKLYAVPGQLIPGLYEERWVDDAVLTTQAFQRSLLQLQFLDALLGELLDRLAREGLLDEVALVVTADHGVSFRPGDTRREISPVNRQDILPVPLFIKAPGQRDGRIVDDPVSALSTLPTLFDLLDLPAPWPMAADSLRAPRAAGPRRAVAKASGVFEVPAGVDQDKWRALDEKLRLFGADAPSFDWGGPRADLVGAALDRLAREPDRRLAGMTLDGSRLFDHVDPASSYAPVYVSGSLGPGDEIGDLAIAVNGTVRATTRAYQPLDSEPRFGALIPERDLLPGANRVEIFALHGPPGSTRVQRLIPTGGSAAHLETDAGGRVMALATGEGRFAVGSEALEGQAWALALGDRFAVTGWAWDRAEDQPPAAIDVFLRGEEIYAGTTTDVNEVAAGPTGGRAARRAGFRFDLPIALVPGLEQSGIRVFARSRSGAAAELQYSYQLQTAAPPTAAIATPSGPRWEIRVSDGRVIPVSPGALEGRVEAARGRGDGRPGVELAGWAADAESGAPAQQVLAFSRGALLVRGPTGAPRPGGGAPPARSAFGSDGFLLRADTPASELADLRVFALAGRGVASELGQEAALEVELVRGPGGAPSAIRRAGVETPLRAGAVRGYVGEASERDGFVWVRGWAMDVDHAAEPRAVLVFHRDRLVAAGQVSGIRVDVNRLFQVPDQNLRSAFDIPVNASRIGNLERDGVQVVALSAAGEASLIGAVLVLERDSAGATGIRSGDGRRFRVRQDAVAGWIEARLATADGLRLSGWAVDRGEPRAPVAILAFAGERQVSWIAPDRPRADAAKSLGLAEIAPAGFTFEIPRAALPGRPEDLRIYALTRDGLAGELADAPRR